MYFTARPSLRNHAASAVVRVGLDGPCWRVTCRLSREPSSPCTRRCTRTTPTSAASCIRIRPTTAYAVAQRPIGCWVEARRCSAYRAGCPQLATGRGGPTRRWPIPGRWVPGRPRSPPGEPWGAGFHRTPELAIQVGGISRKPLKQGSTPGPRRPSRDPEGLRAAAFQRAMLLKEKARRTPDLSRSIRSWSRNPHWRAGQITFVGGPCGSSSAACHRRVTSSPSSRSPRPWPGVATRS